MYNIYIFYTNVIYYIIISRKRHARASFSSPPFLSLTFFLSLPPSLPPFASSYACARKCVWCIHHIIYVNTKRKKHLKRDRACTFLSVRIFIRTGLIIAPPVLIFNFARLRCAMLRFCLRARMNDYDRNEISKYSCVSILKNCIFLCI